MLSFLVTENGIRPLESPNYIGGYLILASKDMTFLPNSKEVVNTGLVIKFPSYEFLYVCIDDSYKNILRIENKIIQNVDNNTFTVSIKNLTNNVINISKNDFLIHFHTKDISNLKSTFLEVENEKNVVNINITNSILTSENNEITIIDNDEVKRQNEIKEAKALKVKNEKIKKEQIKLKEETEAQAKLQAEEQAKKEAEAQAKLQAEEQAKKEAEAQAKKEAKLQAEKETEAQDKYIAKLQAEAEEAKAQSESKAQAEVKTEVKEDAEVEPKVVTRRKYIRKKKLINVEHLIGN